MTLQKFIDNLSEDKQFQVAIKLTKLTLPIWDKYADEKGLTYVDTVVGMTHSVDKYLLIKSIEAVEKYLTLALIYKVTDRKNQIIELRRQFDDPIVALQDLDWELPDEILKTFYAVYNLVDSVLGKGKTVVGESTIYVSINQASDALEISKVLTFDEINKILYEIKNDL